MRAQKTTALLALTLLMGVSCVSTTSTSTTTTPRLGAIEEVSIVPKPTSVEQLEGEYYFHAGLPICYLGIDTMLRSTAEMIAQMFAPSLGENLLIESVFEPKHKTINLLVDTQLEAEEYRLKVVPTGVSIVGGSPAGVFYGAQTLRQLLPDEALQGVKADTVTLPGVLITDKPAFSYRGAMLDVGRHFFSVEEVKSYLDLLAMHKLNRFHWHLTEDQGWRIEIKKYPKLTQVGAWRDKDLVSHSERPPYTYEEGPYGGFYTQEQIKEVVAYASERFIEVIPEIELPGHATAALAAYPFLGCTGKDYKVSSMYSVHYDIFCAGKDTTFAVLEDIFDEVIDLFPSSYINIGGDECMKYHWMECPLCQERIKAEGLKDVYELQSYFVHRIERHIQSRGRQIIGWDEIMEGGLSPTAAVLSWRGTEGGIEAAKLGNRVVMSPYQYCYLDYYQAPDTLNEPLAIRTVLPVEKVYSFDPYEGLNETEQGFVEGLQGNAWSEYIRDLDHLEYMSLPRLAAIAEIGWSHTEKDYEDFRARMGALRRLYDAEGYRYGKHVFEQEQEQESPSAESEVEGENERVN